MSFKSAKMRQSADAWAGPAGWRDAPMNGRHAASGYYPGSQMHRWWKEQRREEMRANPTPAEKVLLDALAADPFLRGTFVFQPILYGYIPDFGREDVRVLVEVDGDVHNTDTGSHADARRDATLRRRGWCVKRFSNYQVMERTADVIESIAACVRMRLNAVPGDR
jgi:very-short-patch-repair endonuclease